MRGGGTILALIVAAIVAFGFYSAAQSVTQKLASYQPAISEGKVGAAGGTITGGAGDQVGRRLRYGHVTFRTHDGEAL